MTYFWRSEDQQIGCLFGSTFPGHPPFFPGKKYKQLLSLFIGMHRFLTEKTCLKCTTSRDISHTHTHTHVHVYFTPLPKMDECPIYWCHVDFWWWRWWWRPLLLNYLWWREPSTFTQCYWCYLMLLSCSWTIMGSSICDCRVCGWPDLVLRYFFRHMFMFCSLPSITRIGKTTKYLTNSNNRFMFQSPPFLINKRLELHGGSGSGLETLGQPDGWTWKARTFGFSTTLKVRKRYIFKNTLKWNWKWYYSL